MSQPEKMLESCPGAVAMGIPAPDPECKGHVLVVDDDRMILELLATILERLGFYVTKAGSGTEAMAALEKRSFCLVITDYKMPDMDGLTMASEIKHRFSDIPVVLTTGGDTAELDGLNGYAKVDVFLQKPFKTGVIIETIREIEENHAISLIR